MVPLKPFRLAIVIETWATCPGARIRLVEDGVIE
jgi:hypothetical protein